MRAYGGDLRQSSQVEFEGVVNKDEGDGKKSSNKKAEKEDGKSGSKGGADIMKIVQVIPAGESDYVRWLPKLTSRSRMTIGFSSETKLSF